MLNILEILLNMSQSRLRKLSQNSRELLKSYSTSSLSPSRSLGTFKTMKDDILPDKITNVPYRKFLEENPLNSNSRVVDSYTARYLKSTIFDPPEPPRVRQNNFKLRNNLSLIS